MILTHLQLTYVFKLIVADTMTFHTTLMRSACKILSAMIADLRKKR
jgi:hypothetical protein